MANRRNPLVLAGLLLASGLSACGSLSDSEGGAGGPAERFANELAAVTCAAEAACCTAQGQTQDGSCRRLTAKVEARRGELFDEAVAKKCLAALATYTCDGDYPSVCLQVFYGTVPLGEPCEFGKDCARPGGAMTACVMDGDFDHWSCKLVVTSAPGEPCDIATKTEIRVCAEGQSCGDVCEEKAAVGADCHGKLCVDGASCEWDANAPGKRCLPYRVVGESCSDRECVEAAWCGTDQICHAKKQAGDACVSDQECVEICHPDTQRCAGKDFYCL